MRLGEDAETVIASLVEAAKDRERDARAAAAARAVLCQPAVGPLLGRLIEDSVALFGIAFETELRQLLDQGSAAQRRGAPGNCPTLRFVALAQYLLEAERAPGTSRHACCIATATALGVHPDAVRRAVQRAWQDLAAAGHHMASDDPAARYLGAAKITAWQCLREAFNEYAGHGRPLREVC